MIPSSNSSIVYLMKENPNKQDKLNWVINLSNAVINDSNKNQKFEVRKT